MAMRIVNAGDFTIFRSVERPWITCTPDRLIYEGDNLVAELSIKCAYYEAAKEWNKACPLGYQIQAQHTMYVLGVDTVYFAVLLNGCSFKWHLVRRNDKWIEKMLKRLDAFWAAIQRGEYPNVDASQATAEALARRYPRPNEGIVELPVELTELGEEYDAILKQTRDLEKRKLLIQNTAKEAMGDKPIGVLGDSTGFGWKANGHGTRTFTRLKKVHVDG
jgi:predicted phage-related endonuclease